MPIACNHPDGMHHDCQYVEMRNRLIPTAERLTFEELKGRGFKTEEEYDAAYGPAFLRTMDRLWHGPRRAS